MKKKFIFCFMILVMLSFIIIPSSIYADYKTCNITGLYSLSDKPCIDPQNKYSHSNKNSIIELDTISPQVKFNLFYNNEILNSYKTSNIETFPETYSDLQGVLTFRGNSTRTSPSFGTIPMNATSLQQTWKFKTSSLSSWGGGSGWTGQPSIIKWPDEIKKIMNVYDKFKVKENFVEVIYASLDGNIYFLDLETGEKSRPPIFIKNAIKGSVALDPRGYPLLYVGQGLNNSGKIGYRIFNLINGNLLYFINGVDSKAYRSWGAFDGAPIINKNTDTLILGGENGILYNVKLNTNFDIENKSISIKPDILKYRYKSDTTTYQGIENSVAAYKNLIFFADNSGTIQCVDLITMTPKWNFFNTDDTDATLTISVEDNVPYIYTGNEVDKQGTSGTCYIRKINGLTGKLIYEHPIKALSILKPSPINGGMLATNIVGKNEINDLVIFTIARYKKLYGGLMIALDKKTGKEVWRNEMPYYAWSSPVDVYDDSGKAYILQCDYNGNVSLLEGRTGKLINKINLGRNIEGSPAVFNNTIVVGTRGSYFYGINIK